MKLSVLVHLTGLGLLFVNLFSAALPLAAFIELYPHRLETKCKTALMSCFGVQTVLSFLMVCFTIAHMCTHRQSPRCHVITITITRIIRLLLVCAMVAIVIMYFEFLRRNDSRCPMPTGRTRILMHINGIGDILLLAWLVASSIGADFVFSPRCLRPSDVTNEKHSGFSRALNCCWGDRLEMVSATGGVDDENDTTLTSTMSMLLNELWKVDSSEVTNFSMSIANIAAGLDALIDLQRAEHVSKLQQISETVYPSAIDPQYDTSVPILPKRAEDIASLVACQQPKFPADELHRLRLAQHLYHFARGAYGWMLQTYEEPLSHLCCLRPCRPCGCEAPLQQVIGSFFCHECTSHDPDSCVNSCFCTPLSKCLCCHPNLNSFMFSSKTRRDDVLLANAVNFLRPKMTTPSSPSGSPVSPRRSLQQQSPQPPQPDASSAPSAASLPDQDIPTTAVFYLVRYDPPESLYPSIQSCTGIPDNQLPIEALCLAVRGTLSLHDTLIDVDTNHISLAAIGLSGCVAHSGILGISLAVHNFLRVSETQTGVLSNWLKSYHERHHHSPHEESQPLLPQAAAPNSYQSAASSAVTPAAAQKPPFLITGHSLGAGVTSMLALLWQAAALGKLTPSSRFSPDQIESLRSFATFMLDHFSIHGVAFAPPPVSSWPDGAHPHIAQAIERVGIIWFSSLSCVLSHTFLFLALRHRPSQPPCTRTISSVTCRLKVCLA